MATLLTHRHINSVAVNGWDCLPHSPPKDYPTLNYADKFSSAFFEGLAGSPYDWESGDVCIIRIGILDYFILCTLQGDSNVLSEHIKNLNALGKI
jgi:hypothetical protein